MLLPVTGLHNTRDLGGLRTADGRAIRPGKLIRSGHLYDAKGDDLQRLAPLVDTVVDFRTPKEREEKPDPALPGVTNLHLPIVDTLTAGLSREREADKAMFARLARDPEGAREYMRTTYRNFVTGDFALSQYSRFIRVLLEPHERAVLWHCTAGKDRAGFATVLLLRLLGVEEDAVLADYLLTNECQRETVNALIAMVSRQMQLPASAEEAVRVMFSADESYLRAADQATAERFGGFDGLARDGLGLTADEIQALRERYLSA